MSMLPREKWDKAVELYQSGLPALAVSEQLHIGEGSVLNAVRRAGFVPRTTSQACRQYHANHSFFDDIQTEEQAYVLGVWTADGCVSDQNVVSLALSVEDIDWLYAIRGAMGSTHHIRIDSHGFTKAGREKHMARLTISSPELANGLRTQGVGPRKTFCVRPWEGPAELMHHYWRGCVDGDGYWREFQKRAGTVFTVGFCGNRFMVEGFSGFIASRIGHIGTLRPNKNIFDVRYSGRELPQAIAKVLYHDATLSLSRKRVLAEHCIAFPIKRPNRIGRRITWRGETLRLHEWAKRTGIPDNTIRARLDRFGHTVDQALSMPVRR